MLPEKLQAEKNPVTEFEIDFETLSKYMKMLQRMYSTDEELIKVIEQMIQLLNF